MLKCGVPLCDAVRMLTINPLSMMNLDLKKGRLIAGFDADICVFDGDVNVKHVICNGEIVA